MNDNDSEKNLKLRDILNEVLVRDLLIVTLLYLFILAQSWKNILLLIFPLISFAFSLFFKILGTNKHHFEIPNLDIKYHPIGLENKHANRLKFTVFFQLILLFWIGAESLYHPQFISLYSIYFIVIFCLVYSFGFYWLMIDIWKNSKIAFTLKSNKSKEKIKTIVSFLRFDNFRLIALINLGYFCIINIVNIFWVLYFNTGFEFYLPGTGIESSEPLYLPFTILILLVGSPAILIFSLNLIYKDVKQINYNDITKILNDSPTEIQEDLISNLKKLNSRYKRDKDRIE